MKYRIVHDIPGRMRVHCTDLHLNRDSALHLDRWVEGCDDMLSASLSTRTGTLVLKYSAALPRSSLLTMLDELQLFGVAKVTRSAVAPLPVGRLFGTLAKGVLSMLARAVLPKGVDRMLVGWRTVNRGAGMVGLIRDGESVRLVLACSGSLLCALIGASPVLRLAVKLCVIVIEHIVRPAFVRDFSLIDEQGRGTPLLLPLDTADDGATAEQAPSLPA